MYTVSRQHRFLNYLKIHRIPALITQNDQNMPISNLIMSTDLRNNDVNF